MGNKIIKMPDNVKNIIETLEANGYEAYAVGGCVRDALMGRIPHDWDITTSATPMEVKALFRRTIDTGIKHGTVGVVTEEGVVEITTFRTEGGYQDNRHPEWVKFVPNIEQDLARRDFTVNAMAYSPKRGFADPFGGREDLKNHILRAVGEPELRFREDSLRILRGARFAVKYQLEPDAATEEAMVELAPLMDNLARERVWDELCKLILLADAEDLLRFAPVITQVIPELAPLIGFDQKNRHHIYDIYTHTAQVVQAVPQELTLRWAALLHDIGKPASFTLGEDGQGHFYGHAQISAEMADAVLRRLKAPAALRERTVLLIDKHMVWLEVSSRSIRRWISRLGMEAMDQLMILQEADTGGKGTENPSENPYFSRIQAIIRQIKEDNTCLTLKDLAVNGHDLMALGHKGKAIGENLNRLLGLVLDETIPNEKAALLAALQEDTL